MWVLIACTGHPEGVSSETAPSQGKPGCHTQARVDGQSLSLARSTIPWLQPFPATATTSMGWLSGHGGSSLLGQERLHEFY